MLKTGISTSNQFIQAVHRGRRHLRPLWLCVCIFSALPGFPQSPLTNQIIAHDCLGDITQGDLRLYLRAKERNVVPGKRSSTPLHEDIQDFSTLRILAASAETSSEGLLDTPSARWGLWKIHTAEAYTRFMEEVFTPSRNPSPAEIEAYYTTHQKDFEEKGHIRFRSIFLDATRCADEKARKDLEQKAGEILARLVAGSTVPVVVPLEHFLSVASESMGQPTSSFEIRGPFALSQISPTIEKAAMNLEPGQVGPVVVTKHGYQILRLESKAVPGTHKLDEVQTRIRETLRLRETQARRKDFIDRMLHSGKLEVSEEGLAALVKSSTDPQRVSQIMLSDSFSGGLTAGRYLDYLSAGNTPLRLPGDSDEKVRNSHRDTIQRFLLVPDLTYQEAEAAGLTSETTFQERLKVGRILFLGNFYLKHLVEAALQNHPRITPEEIRGYYDSHPDEFMNKEEYLLREIAAYPRDTTSPPALEFAFREAEEKVLKAIEEIHNGVPEEEVVKQVSQGNEAVQGGLTSWTLHGTRYTPEIWKALSETPTGVWNDQVFRFSNQVIGLKVEDRKASERRPLSDCTFEIMGILERKCSQDEEQRIRRAIQAASGLTTN